MRKSMLSFGVILIVVGIIVAGISAAEIAVSVDRGSGFVNENPNGIYYSGELNVPSGWYVEAMSNANDIGSVYPIPSQYVNEVNKSNFDYYSVLYGGTAYYANDAAVWHNVSPGSYYLMTDEGSVPPLSYEVLKIGLSAVTYLEALVILGVLLVILGIVAVIMSVWRSKRRIQQP